MALWWIGNAVLLVAGVVVAVTANRVLRHLLGISKLADQTLKHGLALSGNLQAVPKLVETKRLTGAARGLVGRYGGALVALL